MSKKPTKKLPQGWDWVRLGDVLTESLLPGTDGLRAKKLTVKLYGRGIQEKIERIPGSEKTRYYSRRAGQFIYSKLDFLNGAFAIIPFNLDGYESTIDLPTFDIDPSINSQYLLSYVARPEFYAGGLISADGTRKARRVQPDEFLSIFIPLPPLPVQRWIADALAGLGEWSEKSEDIVNNLQASKIAFVDLLLSEANSGAKFVKLSDIGILQTGLQIGKKYTEPLKKYPYLRVANVKDGYIDTGVIKTVEIPENEAARRMLKTGDVLITEGGDADKLGRGSIWRGELETCLHQNHIFVFRPEPKKILPEYLALALQGSEAKSYFLSNAKQTTNLASINSTQLKAFSLRVPNIEKQREAIEKAKQFELWVASEQEKISQLQKIKRFLLHQLLSGTMQPKAGWAAIIPELAESVTP